jgi:hypothetical protein
MVSLTLTPSTANAAARNPACRGFNVRSAHTYDGRAHRVKALIVCVFDQVGVPAQADKAKKIAYRESRYWTFAIHHATYRVHDCLGLFQHMRMYWHERAVRLPRWAFPHRRTVTAFNARANVWATAKMVKTGGWGPWATAS